MAQTLQITFDWTPLLASFFVSIERQDKDIGGGTLSTDTKQVLAN